MQKLFLLTISLIFTSLANASVHKSMECKLISGTIIQKQNKPVYQFMPGKKHLANGGIVVTHTKFYIRDNNGVDHAIIMNNLFYSWVSDAQAGSNRDAGVIESLLHNYPLGSNVEACGKAVASGKLRGLKSVHASCNGQEFNGYLKINGSNVMDNTRFGCQT